MTFWIEYDDNRFDFPTLKTAADYFHGCLVDETIGSEIRLIDTDGKTVVAMVDWSGVRAVQALAYIKEFEPRCYTDTGGLARSEAFREVRRVLSGEG